MIDTPNFDEYKPPWIAFPEITAEALVPYLKQGVTQAWFDQVWRPFWSLLSASEKAAYLKHWHASPEWIDAIEFTFEPPENFDAEAEGREFAAYLQTLRDKKQLDAKRSWLSRLFGRGRQP
jgi:hypothetical protein